MSALTPKADVCSATPHVRYVPIADISFPIRSPRRRATEWTSLWPEERKRASVECTLLKRPCTAADIAGAIVFLCADNSMITAQTAVVDGGYSL